MLLLGDRYLKNVKKYQRDSFWKVGSHLLKLSKWGDYAYIIFTQTFKVRWLWTMSWTCRACFSLWCMCFLSGFVNSCGGVCILILCGFSLYSAVQCMYSHHQNRISSDAWKHSILYVSIERGCISELETGDTASSLKHVHLTRYS